MTNVKKQRVIAVIAAKGCSKRLPEKNLKSLLGKPLIAHTILQALGSKLIDKIVVSTEDKEIAIISKKFGAEVPFKRPKFLTRDKYSTIDVILHAIEWFEKKGESFDLVVSLEPTSPLRKSSDIDKAIEKLLKNFNNADSLVSLGKVHLENPFILKKIENGKVKPFLGDSKRVNIFNQKELPETFFPYGVVYVSKISIFKKQKTFYQSRTIPFFIERWQNYEIDDLYDFACVEAILKERKKAKK